MFYEWDTMNIKKQCAILLLLVPGFIFSVTIEEILKDTAFRKNNPELVAQYDQAEKEHHETIEYKKYEKAYNLHVSLLRGEHNLMSRPEAFGHWVNGNIPLRNVVHAELDFNSFNDNCHESFLKLDEKNRTFLWKDCDTKECELFREMSERDEDLTKEAAKNREVAMAELVNTDEAKKVSLIGSEVEIAYARFKILENKKSR